MPQRDPRALGAWPARQGRRDLVTELHELADDHFLLGVEVPEHTPGRHPDRRGDLVLCGLVLVANAVRHGAGSGRLVMYTSEGSLSCQVTDAGPGTHPWPLQEGHGLWIVHAAADKVTVSSGPGGSQVTAVFGWPAGLGSDRPGGQAT